MIGSASNNALPASGFWQAGKRRCGASFDLTRETSPRCSRQEASRGLTSRTEFQAFQSGGNVQSDLALHAERLKRDGVVGAADQHIAPGADADRGAALHAGIRAGEIARRQTRDRQARCLGLNICHLVGRVSSPTIGVGRHENR